MTETRPHHFPPDGGPQQDAGAGGPAGGIPHQAGPLQPPPWGAAPGPEQPLRSATPAPEQPPPWGGAPAPEQPPPWGAPPRAGGYPPPPGPFPPTAPRSGRKALIIALALVLGIPVTLLLAAVVTVAFRDDPVSGTVTGAAAPQAGATTPVGGQRTLIQLQKGDCYNSLPLPPDGSTVRVASVAVVPCTEAHTGQVIATLAYKDVSWAAGGDAKSTEGCTSAFSSGVRPEAQRDSRYALGRLHRDLDQPGGTKTAYVACIVATDAPVTGSVLK